MKIGFIGLGIMGSRMALNLVRGGVDVTVHNRTKEKATALLDAGAKWVDSPAGFTDVDVLFTMLAHPEAITAVSHPPNGFLRHLKPNALWVDCSTVNPNFSREMAAAASAANVRFLEAPVAGTKPQAAGGQLVFFTGGSADDVAQCQLYFELMGQKVVHVGEAGMATSLKIVVNMMLATAMATFAEGMALGEALGLSQETLFNVLIGGPVTAPFLASKREMMEMGNYETQFPLRWMHKDLHMVDLAAYETAVSVPIAQAAKAQYANAVNKGNGELDFAAIYQHLATKQ